MTRWDVLCGEDELALGTGDDNVAYAGPVVLVDDEAVGEGVARGRSINDGEAAPATARRRRTGGRWGATRLPVVVGAGWGWAVSVLGRHGAGPRGRCSRGLRPWLSRQGRVRRLLRRPGRRRRGGSVRGLVKPRPARNSSVLRWGGREEQLYILGELKRKSEKRRKRRRVVVAARHGLTDRTASRGRRTLTRGLSAFCLSTTSATSASFSRIVSGCLSTSGGP